MAPAGRPSVRAPRSGLEPAPRVVEQPAVAGRVVGKRGAADSKGDAAGRGSQVEDFPLDLIADALDDHAGVGFWGVDEQDQDLGAQQADDVGGPKDLRDAAGDRGIEVIPSRSRIDRVDEPDRKEILIPGGTPNLE